MAPLPEILAIREFNFSGEVGAAGELHEED
jgi:hypothetical protein